MNGSLCHQEWSRLLPDTAPLVGPIFQVPPAVTRLYIRGVGGGGSGQNGGAAVPPAGAGGTWLKAGDGGEGCKAAFTTIVVVPGDIINVELGLGGSPSVNGGKGGATHVYRNRALVLTCPGGAGGGQPLTGGYAGGIGALYKQPTPLACGPGTSSPPSQDFPKGWSGGLGGWAPGGGASDMGVGARGGMASSKDPNVFPPRVSRAWRRRRRRASV